MKAFTCPTCRAKGAFFSMEVYSSKLTSEGSVTQYRKCRRADCDTTSTTFIITKDQKAALDRVSEMEDRIQELEQPQTNSSKDVDLEKRLASSQRKYRAVIDKLSKIVDGA